MKPQPAVYDVDPELVPWLPLLKTEGGLMEDPVAGRRRLADAFAASREEPAPDIQIEDRTIPGLRHEPDVPVRIYQPKSRAALSAALINIHGGGFVVGDLNVDETFCRAVAGVASIIVISVDYRLAPENPYPAGLHDCYAALVWAATDQSLGIDPNWIGIGGESAGAGLAAAVALYTRDHHGPVLCFQSLEIPELDDRLTTRSMQRFVDTPGHDRHESELGWQHYLSGAPADLYAAPSRATDLSGLPSAYVSVAEFDPLRDEGLDYALRLTNAGVHTELHLFPGTFHGSTHLVPEAQVSKRTTQCRIGAIARALAKDTPALERP